MTRKGSHLEEAFGREGAGLRPLRRVGSERDGLLRVAEAVFRERRGGFPAEGEEERAHARSEEDREARNEADAEERGARRADARARGAKKRTWGTLKERWVPHDTRDEVVDFVGRWSEKTEIAIYVLVLWLGISLSKFYD